MSLVGREPDLRVVEDFLGGRTRPRYPILVITGPPGTGRSALLEAVVWIAEQHGCRVLRSAGWSTRPSSATAA